MGAQATFDASILLFNSKLNSLQRYDVTHNYRMLYSVVPHLFQHNLKISHHRYV
jgi:hypothetical protein